MSLVEKALYICSSLLLLLLPCVVTGDECKSTVSDTWSTDVLASDSEPPELNQVDRLEEVQEEVPRPPGSLLGPEVNV